MSVLGDTATTMGIAWTTLSGTAEANVEYGLKPGALTLKAKGAVETRISATLGTTSTVTLSSLQPSTRYYYRVGGPQGGWSAERSFVTGPKVDAVCGTYRFAYAGDSRAESWESGKGASVKWPAISQKIASYKPRFMLHGGDFVHDGNKQEQYAHMLTVSEPVTSTLPIMWSIGNHDDGPGEGDGANFNRIFHLPKSDKAIGGSGTEDFYAFRYGNGLFISLSTDTFTGGSTKFAQQAGWLDKLLTQTKARWKVVYLHKPIYTEYLFINHKPNEAKQNAPFVPIFNKHHVDLVIGSHNHFYERFAPSNCSNGGSDVPCPVATPDKGTVYITSGGGGAFPVFLSGGVNAVRLATSGQHHFLLFDVANHKLSLRVLDENGGTIDTYAITKKVTGPDPCAAGPDAGAGASDGGSTSDGSASADGAATKSDGAATKSDSAASKADSAAAKADSSGGGGTSDAGSKKNDDDGGCSCRVGSTGAADTTLVLLGLLGLVALARRRRRG